MFTTEQTDLWINNTYNGEQARHYFVKHMTGFERRLSNWLEHSMAARALAIAGKPKSVLDLPCGAGRFWELLASVPDRDLLGADYSAAMISTALTCQPPHVTARFKTIRTSAFDINLPNGSVDCIFSMRLLHHLHDREARARMLREFHRVSRDTVCVSLWVDRNIQAWWRCRGHRNGDREQTRFLFRRSQIECEFLECGFDILGSVALLPRLSMWHTYVLRRGSIQ